MEIQTTLGAVFPGSKVTHHGDLLVVSDHTGYHCVFPVHTLRSSKSLLEKMTQSRPPAGTVRELVDDIRYPKPGKVIASDFVISSHYTLHAYKTTDFRTGGDPFGVFDLKDLVHQDM